MDARVEATSSVPDTLKWVVAVAVLGGALTAFYVYDDQSLLLRVVGLLAIAGIVLAIIYQTEKGRFAWSFLRESRMEVRKVVWPTRKETVQTTGIVIAIVFIVAVILWFLDTLLGYVVRELLGLGG